SDTGYFAEIVGGPRDGTSVIISWYTSVTPISGNTGKFRTSATGAGLPQVGDVLRIYSCSQFPGLCYLGTGNYFDLDLDRNDPTDNFIVHDLTVSPDAEVFFGSSILRGLDSGAFGSSPVGLANDSVIYRSHFGGAFDATRCT